MFQVMRFPLHSPGKYIYITTFFSMDPKVFYKNIHTNHFPTGVQSLTRYRVAGRIEMMHSSLQIYSRREILAQGQRGKTYTCDKCQELINVHRQQTEAWFQPTNAEMSWSTLKGKDHFGWNLNAWPQELGYLNRLSVLSW